MKNFFKNIKNYVAEHKAKTIITVIAVILITILIIIGITATKTETPKVADKKIIKVETKKKAVKKEDTKKTETAKNEDVKQEEEVKSTDKAESPAIKEETVNKPSKSTAKQSATGNTTSKPAAKPSTNASKPATKTPRWVVDRAAWTETKQVPVYDYVYVYKVYGVKSDKSTEYIGNYYSYDEACAAMDNFDRSKYVTTGYASNLEEKLIRTDTQTINHPEEGHWEY
jgi:cytoskeletal protein RodZ